MPETSKSSGAEGVYKTYISRLFLKNHFMCRMQNPGKK